MKRYLTDHVVNIANLANLRIETEDAPGSGGAHHLYKITNFDSDTNLSDPWVDAHGAPAVHSRVLFQNGPVTEYGANGVTHEALLTIVIDRLRSFQAGPFACHENAIALTHFETGLMWLHARTRARMARGVEGSSQK